MCTAHKFNKMRISGAVLQRAQGRLGDMLDLSEEPHDENVGICAQYFKKMAPMNQILEMEIGITGGVEDGVDNSGVRWEGSTKAKYCCMDFEIRNYQIWSKCTNHC